jgi:hypothetical protein
LGHLIHNERLKLTAGNLDRASSGALAAGFIAPAVSLATGSHAVTFSPWLILSTAVWILAAFALHYAARLILGGLRE